MVEINGGKGESRLKERVERLSRELDQIEQRHEQALDALRQVLTALGGFCQLGDASGPVATAMEQLKKVAHTRTKKLDHEALGEAVDALKRALLTVPRKEGAPGGGAETSAEAAAAGRHVALALLSGLRLGEASFDGRLEAHIARLADYMNLGKVRPAMVELADLLDDFRQVQERRRSQAEAALREVLDELVNTEAELTQAFLDARQRFSQAGQDQDASLTASAGDLARKLASANDIEVLRSSVLDHLRGLREAMKARQAREQEIIAHSQAEMDRLRQALEHTRQSMAEAERKSQEASREALTDSMTGVWNKRAFSRGLGEALAGPGQAPVALIVFDLDYFKSINDNFGHQAGDKALKALAEQTGKSLRKDDVLFRYAGDEFCVLLVRTDLREALEVAERVRLAAGAIRFTYRGEGEHVVSLSLGVAQSRPGETPESLFKRADEALLAAKRAGRNRAHAAT